MNKKSIFSFQVFSIFFTFVLGTLLHFTYQWSGNNLVIASFSSINESTWEHLKLVFFPMLITTIIGTFYFKNTITNFLCSKTIAIIIAISFITIFHYTYTGIIGNSFAVLDIASFFIAILLGEYIAYKMINSSLCCKNNFFCFILLSVLLFCFIVFTYYPPQINYFKDPITGSYGIIKSP